MEIIYLRTKFYKKDYTRYWIDFHLAVIFGALLTRLID